MVCKTCALGSVHSIWAISDILRVQNNYYIINNGLYCWAGDGAGNTVEETSSIFSLIRMR